MALRNAKQLGVALNPIGAATNYSNADKWAHQNLGMPIDALVDKLAQDLKIHPLQSI